ncbi:MAG: CRISPR system precrRNA processing endoribonuclease RAMP protein Cas6 [Desulfurococcaceae archaeon]
MERYLFKAVITLREVDEELRSETKPGLGEFFTGKLVKSLLIDGNPKLKPFFKKSSGSAPKLIHVTPLYVEKFVNGKIRLKCIHTFRNKVFFNKFSFYVGFIDIDAKNSPSIDNVYNALLNISGRHRFTTRVFDVELVSAESIDVEEEAIRAVESLMEIGKIRLVFSSPTLLRDPFRSGKYKSLTPTPINIFSTPVYVNLYITRKLNQKLFIKTLVVIHRLLSEPYSIHRTTKIVHVKYEEGKNPIPTLIGYVNLYFNKHYQNQYTAKGIDTKTLLKETFATTLTLGTGTSRATGFGHITITTPSGTS